MFHVLGFVPAGYILEGRITLEEMVRRKQAEMNDGRTHIKLRSSKREETCSGEEMGLFWPAQISLSQCVTQSIHPELDISLGRRCPLPIFSGLMH